MFIVDNNQIKERVCDFRKMSKTTQQDLAIHLGIGRGSYQAREASGAFSWEEIVQLADFFDVSPFFIQYGVEDEEIRTLAEILREKDGTFHKPAATIFDNIEEEYEKARLVTSFLNLDPNHQMRIKRYISSQNY